MSDLIDRDPAETESPELTNARAEDSLLFRADKSSGLIQLATLAEDYFLARTESSTADLMVAADAAPLLLPSRAVPARARNRLVGLLAVAAMVMGLATAGLAYNLATAPRAQGTAEPATRPEPLAVPAPLDPPAPVRVAVAEPAPEPAPEPEPEPAPVVVREVPAPAPAPIASRPRPRPRPAPPTTTRPCGDEIECLLAGAGQTPPAPVTAPKPDPELPARLSTLAISNAMKQAQRRAASCDARFGGGGNVKLQLRVAGDGEVTSVKVVSAPNPQLGTCAAEAASTQRFPSTHNGASFAWLFLYR